MTERRSRRALWHERIRCLNSVTLSAPRGMTLSGEEENNYYVFGENLGNG